MFRVYLVNFGYFSERRFATLADAVAWAKSTTYECSIYDGDKHVASWSYFGGLREVR